MHKSYRLNLHRHSLINIESEKVTCRYVASVSAVGWKNRNERWPRSGTDGGSMDAANV